VEAKTKYRSGTVAVRETVVLWNKMVVRNLWLPGLSQFGILLEL
jgi:hypothetical protein